MVMNNTKAVDVSIHAVSPEFSTSSTWENALKIDPDLGEVRELVGRYKE